MDLGCRECGYSRKLIKRGDDNTGAQEHGKGMSEMHMKNLKRTNQTAGKKVILFTDNHSVMKGRFA